MAGDEPGPAEGHAYGAAAVTQALEGVDFPCTKEDLIEGAGDRTVEWEEGEETRLADLLEQLPDREYQSMAGVVEAIGEIK